MLADVAAFPRKALTDSYFFRGLKVSEDDLIEAMDAADDALCRNLLARGIKEQCRQELDIISLIEKATMEPKKKCEVIRRILGGDPMEVIDEELRKNE